MRKSIAITLCIAAVSAISVDAAAHGMGGGGGMGGRGMSGMSDPVVSGGGSGTPSVMIASPSSHALINSNGRFAADRDLGLSRAEDRMGAQGLKHERATDAALKRHSGSGRRHSSMIDTDAR